MPLQKANKESDHLMNISVFGGSKTPPESNDYQRALAFGRGLAQAGHTVMTGGYLGTMEAVSRGAFEAGGKVVGVTFAEIESWRPVKPNTYLTDEVKCDTLLERLMHLITACDMAAAMPGGIGTLTEIAMAWNLLVIDIRQTPPILLVGPGWQQTMQAFYASLDEYIPSKDRDFLVLCPNVKSALDEVNKYA